MRVASSIVLSIELSVHSSVGFKRNIHLRTSNLEGCSTVGPIFLAICVELKSRDDASYGLVILSGGVNDDLGKLVVNQLPAKVWKILINLIAFLQPIHPLLEPAILAQVLRWFSVGGVQVVPSRRPGCVDEILLPKSCWRHLGVLPPGILSCVLKNRASQGVKASAEAPFATNNVTLSCSPPQRSAPTPAQPSLN